MNGAPHFEISAAVVRQLGEELVSDEVTALVELVKNAYDADASYAHVVVDTRGALPAGESRFPGAQGYITIEDDGMGMDEEDIRRGWLVISLSGKRAMKARGDTTPKGRTPLGDKGLGRLSTQKLGHNLDLITRKTGANDTQHVSFSWNAFTESSSLASVPVTIGPAARGRKRGTLLAVSDLRDPEVWRGTAGDRLARDLSQIISPFPQARPFMVTLRIDGVPVDLGQISAQVLNAAVGRFTVDYEEGELALNGRIRLAKLRGNQRDEDLQFFERRVVADNGADFFNFLLDHRPPVAIRRSADPSYFLEFDYAIGLASLGEVKKRRRGEVERIDVDPTADPGPFHAEIDEFLLRADDSGLRLSGLNSSSEIHQLVKRHIGVKVFRDGFGVRPYGINGEDWLRLGAQQTSATSYYGLRPNNVVGFVAISEAKNSHLKEKTDREGFVANPYSENFRRLMTHSTEKIGGIYEWLRRTYNRYREEKTAGQVPMADGREAVQSAEKIADQLAEFSERAATMEGVATEARQKLEAIAERVGAEPLLASKAEHELAPLMREAAEAIRIAQQLVVEHREYAAQGEQLAAIVASIGPRLDVLRDQLGDFSELAGLGLLAEALSHEVQNQTDRLMQKATAASNKARKSLPPNADLLLFGQDVVSSASALRRQIGHLTPSLRYQREKIESFGVASVVDEARSYFMDRWGDKGPSFEVVPSSVDFHIRANRGRLTQVIDNLVLNSEYWLGQLSGRSTSPPVVYVQYNAPHIHLWDSGLGIDPAVDQALFEPFVTLKPREVGRGLGLFITSQILDSIGCTISLLHERNSHGRRYKFELDLSGVVDAGQ